MRPADLERARGRVERVEEAFAHAHVRAGEGVEQGGLAGVRISRERDRRKSCPLALLPHRAARGLRAAKAAPERRDAVPCQAAVRLDLRLARAPGADAGAEPLEVRPEAAHAGEVVLELGQLDLELALRRAGVVGEDVEDDRRAVDHRHVELLLHVALLARQQLVVAGHQVRPRGFDLALHLVELASPQIAVWVRAVAPLHDLPGHRHAGGAQQLAQLRQIGLARGRGDAESALACPLVANALAVAGLAVAAVPASVHPVKSRPRVLRRP